jgi:hypothetical protein
VECRVNGAFTALMGFARRLNPSSGGKNQRHGGAAMPRSKTPAGDCKKRDSKAGAQETGAASSPAAGPSDDAPLEPTVEALIQGLETARQLAIDRKRATAAVMATVAIDRLMARSKTPEGDRKRRARKTRRKTAKDDGADSSPTAAPSGDAATELTVDALIQGLDEARRYALTHNRAASAVSATIAIARLLRFLPDTPGRPPSVPPKPGPAPQFKFDGNYHNAARRIALLLQLGKKEREGGGQAGGKDDRTDT